MLLGMLEFFLVHESTEVKRDVSLTGGYVNGKHGGCEKMKEVSVKHFFCSGITQNVSFPLFL